MPKHKKQSSISNLGNLIHQSSGSLQNEILPKLGKTYFSLDKAQVATSGEEADKKWCRCNFTANIDNFR